MKKFIEDNYERLLVVLTILGLLVLGTYFVWGGRFLTTSFNDSLKVEGRGKEVVKFNIEGAKNLNLDINF